MRTNRQPLIEMHAFLYFSVTRFVTLTKCEMHDPGLMTRVASSATPIATLIDSEGVFNGYALPRGTRGKALDWVSSLNTTPPVMFLYGNLFFFYL